MGSVDIDKCVKVVGVDLFISAFIKGTYARLLGETAVHCPYVEETNSSQVAAWKIGWDKVDNLPYIKEWDDFVIRTEESPELENDNRTDSSADS